MKDIRLTHFYTWKAIPDELVSLVMREFADNGARSLVLGELWTERLIREPAFFNFLNVRLKKFGLDLFECHGLWGAGYDLNIINRPRRKGMIEDHKMGMEYAASFGCKTYTVHIGPYYPGMEEPIEEALEQLIPAAEKTGIILAIENGFDPGNAPDALLRYLTKFQSPFFGCCLDTGHANVMLPAPGKDPERYAGYVKGGWGGKVIQEPDPIGKLSAHIVTSHLHDNDGYADGHMLPGAGTVEWEKWIPALKQCPRLVSLQNETSSVAFQISIRKVCETFDRLMQL